METLSFIFDLIACHSGLYFQKSYELQYVLEHPRCGFGKRAKSVSLFSLILKKIFSPSQRILIVSLFK